MCIDIKEDLYGTDLKQYLLKKSLNEDVEHYKCYTFLFNLCKIKLQLSDVFKDICYVYSLEDIFDYINTFELYNSSNIVIKARSTDFLSYIKKGSEAIRHKDEASKLYLKLFDLTHSFEVLYRAVSIRDLKSMCNSAFVMSILERLPEIDTCYHKVLIIEALLKSYKPNELSSFGSFIEQCLNNTKDDNNYFDYRRYLKIMLRLNLLTKLEHDHLCALSYEFEADNIISNAEPRTIYPAIKANYQHAYNTIFPIKKSFNSDYQRINKKLNASIKEFDKEFMSLPPITIYSIPEKITKIHDEYIQSIKLTTFDDLVNAFLHVELYGDVISKLLEMDKPSLMRKLFTPLISKNGYTEALPTQDDFDLMIAHLPTRLITLNFLQKIFNYYLYSDLNFDEVYIYQYLKNIKPKYIEESSYTLWAIGIHHALRNDMASASYTLLPLLERALRYLNDCVSGNSRKLEKQVQSSFNLTDTLNRLDGIISNNSLNELKLFLNKREGVNFRNNLLHGFLISSEINKYGLYLLWICIKLIHTKETSNIKLLE